VLSLVAPSDLPIPAASNERKLFTDQHNVRALSFCIQLYANENPAAANYLKRYQNHDMGILTCCAIDPFDICCNGGGQYYSLIADGRSPMIQESSAEQR
jgi:hypothetical protein